MADFLLSVGVDVGLSYDQMQKDISDLVTRLNQNPQRVRVGLEIDHSAIERFRTEVANIHNSMDGLGRVTVSPVDTAGLNSTIDDISRLVQSTQGAISTVQTMRAELNSVNSERIQQAIASINGISAEGAASLTRSLSEANVRANEVRARLLEAADAEQQLVALQVRGTNESGHMVNYLMTYNTETGEISRRMVDITARLEDATTAESHRATTVREIADLYRQMHALMRTNTNATNTASYTELTNQAQLLQDALALARTESISIDEALTKLGTSGATAIGGARDAMSAFRLEMEQTGTSGSVNLTTMYNTVAQMQTLLNNNAGYFNLSTYTNLQTQVNLLAQAIEFASNGGMTLNQALIHVGLDGSTAILNAREAMSAFKAEMSGATAEEERLTIGTSNYRTAIDKINTLLRQVRANTEKWTAAKTGKSSADYQVYADQARELENLTQRLSTGTITMREFNAEYSRIKSTASGAETAIRASGEATKTWFQRLGGLTAKFGTWFSITRVIMAAYRAVREMVSAVIDLDAAMTELKKVTDESDVTYSNFLENASDRATKLGASLSDIVNASADFARLGYNIKDAEKLSDAATVYKNVGDGIEDISQASESIIATLQAFFSDVENPADMAMNIVDKFNEVGNNYAISSEGVGEALLRSAAAMKAANNTLDETIALAAAANTVVQDPEKVGTTLKTVSMFLRAAKTEAEEAGESTDGMAESVSKLREEILSLTGGKVDIQIDEDNFKSTYQILKELSEVWGELSDITQANILEKVGGKRNSNVVAALLENFSVAEEALKTSADSAGSALAENEKHLDSVQGKIDIMKASFQALSASFMSSDLLKFFIEAATGVLGLVNGITKISNALGGLNTVLIATVGIIATIKAESIKIFLTTTLPAALSKIKSTVSTFFIGLKRLPSVIKAMNSQTALAVPGTSKLSVALKTLGISASTAQIAIGAITAVLTIAISAFNIYKEDIKKTQQATIDAAKESKEHIEALESSLKSYLDLDTSASESDKANAIKAVTEQLNNKTEALKKATEAEKGYTDEVKKSVLADYQEAAGKAKDAAVTAQEKIAEQWNTDYNSSFTIDVNNNRDNESVYDLVKNILGEYIELDTYYAEHGGEFAESAYFIGDSRTKSKINTKDLDSLLQYYELLKKAQAEVQQKALELGKQGNNLLESPLYKGISQIVDSEANKNNIDEYITYRTEEIFDYTIADNGIPETIDDFNKLKAIMLEEAGNSDILTDAITDRLTTAFSGLANEATKAENKVSNLDFTVDTETLSKQLETQREEISNIADSYKKVNDIIDEYNRTGNLTLDNLETLLSVGDEYIGTLFDENGQLSLNKESYVKLAKAKLEDIRYSMLENAISSLNQLNKGDEATANNELAESTGNLTEQTLKLVAARKLDEGVDPSAIKEVCQTYYQYCAIIDNIELGLENNADATLGATDATNAQKEALEADKSALEAQKTALEKAKQEQEDYKKSLEDNKSSLEDLIKLTEDYIKQTKEDEKDALEESKKNISERIDKEIELLEAEKERHDQEKKMAESASNLAKANLNMQIAGLDNSATGKQNYKKAKDEYDNTLSDYSESAYERSYELKKQALEDYKENEEQRYDELIEKIDEYLSDEVKLYRDACEMVDGDSQALYNNLLNYVHTYTTQTDSEFNHMWNNAQSALSQYNDLHLSTFSLMDYLQGTIYNTEIIISGYETQINDVGTAIDNVGSAIDAVSDSVNNNAAAISNWNNAYQQQKSLIAKSAYNGYVDYNGKRYYTTVDPSRNQTTAISDLMAQIRNDTGSSVDFNTIKNNIKKYAKGTKSAKGGLSIVDEEGINTELIPNKVGNGRYTILPEGNPVFSKAMTNELFDFSSNPDSYFSHFLQGNSELRNITHNYPSDLASKVWDKLKSDSPSVKVSNNRSVSPTIQINIQGDATQSTVKALQKETDNIVQKVMKQTLSIVDKNKNYAKW